MDYQECIDFLFNQLPAYEKQGDSGYKPGLGTTEALAHYHGDPHRRLRCIHIAGTNGKGSVSNMLAAVLQSQGYRVGLYTSPHLVDFAERIRVDGVPIGHDAVVDFVERSRGCEVYSTATFFEFTTIMAFDYFARCQVDFAVVEVGLGGRLDSTNIITPLLSVITNISLDHTSLLGDTLTAIAGEKAGIIKRGVPVVIGEDCGEEVDAVFCRVAADNGATLHRAEPVDYCGHDADGLHLLSRRYGPLVSELTGDYQLKNLATALTALDVLADRCGVEVGREAVAYGLAHVGELTGFTSRWTKLGEKPLVVCDPGHNQGAWRHISAQLSHLAARQLHMVIGFVADKDVDAILAMMPADAVYYFTQVSSRRALPAKRLCELAAAHGLHGDSYADVVEAQAAARRQVAPDDAIFIGGSFYLLGELLACRSETDGALEG